MAYRRRRGAGPARPRRVREILESFDRLARPRGPLSRNRPLPRRQLDGLRLPMRRDRRRFRGRLLVQRLHTDGPAAAAGRSREELSAADRARARQNDAEVLVGSEAPGRASRPHARPAGTQSARDTADVRQRARLPDASRYRRATRCRRARPREQAPDGQRVGAHRLHDREQIAGRDRCPGAGAGRGISDHRIGGLEKDESAGQSGVLATHIENGAMCRVPSFCPARPPGGRAKAVNRAAPSRPFPARACPSTSARGRGSAYRACGSPDRRSVRRARRGRASGDSLRDRPARARRRSLRTMSFRADRCSLRSRRAS